MRKRLFIILALALVLSLSGGGYYFYRQSQAKAEAAAATPAATTAQVARGTLTISVDGSGSVEPASELNVAFQSSGVLAEVLVKVGDKVQAGQLLARLDDTDAQATVAQAQISLRQAEISLERLTKGATAEEIAAAQGNLASAKATLADLSAPASTQEVLAARETLKSAQGSLAELLAKPDADTVASAKADLTLAEIEVQTAQAAYDRVASQPDVAMTSQALALQQATLNYQKAKATYDAAVQPATSQEIASAKAQVAQAQASLDSLLEKADANELAAARAKVDETQAALDTLLNGATAEELETAQLNVQQAQLTLDNAQRTLEQTRLMAPMSGTVTAVSAQAGESVGSSTLITLADLEQPVLTFWVDESDMESVAVGNPIEIVFDALPDYTYSGKIVSIDPALQTVSNTPAVQATASIDLSAHPTQLLSGMNASVTVVAGQAKNALLVPVEALREIADGKFAVMVAGADGSMQLRPVEVGLKDDVQAEIKSGLSEGENVSISTGSTTTTTSTATKNATSGGQMPFGGGMPVPGGQP